MKHKHLNNRHKIIQIYFLIGVEYENDTEGEHNHTTVTTINRTLASPTGLRLQDHYVIFYVNAARLLVQVRNWKFCQNLSKKVYRI
jgi:hypothetical protein